MPILILHGASGWLLLLAAVIAVFDIAYVLNEVFHHYVDRALAGDDGTRETPGMDDLMDRIEWSIAEQATEVVA